MIKRFIACLTICLIITGLFSPVFSDASALPQPNWNDPGISEIINISDLTGWMLNGGTYDVSTYTDAESFMNDYYYGRTSTKLVDGNDLYYNQFGIGQDLYNIGAKNFSNRLDTNRMMSSSFREHSGYGRRFSEQANEALLNTGNLYDMKIPLLNDIEFANFVGYNHDALRLYSEFFDHSDTPDSNIPDGYEWIETVGSFSIGNERIDISQTPLNAKPISWGSEPINNVKSFDAYSFYSPDGLFNNSLASGFGFYTLDIFDINIYEDGNYWVVDFSDMGSTYTPNTYFYIPGYDMYINYNSTWKYGDGYIYGWSTWSQSNYTGSTQPLTGFDNALNWVFNHFRHINLYVDNILWVSADGNSLVPTITPEFPDAVCGEELPTTTWPISRPRAPYYTSVPGMLQAIEDAIQGDGKLDIDDLKPYLTDENGDPVPNPIFDPEPVPIPVPDPVNPDVVPGLPELPVIPLDMPGYNGVSVLAEIINFTNQSLPTSLIVTFWGIVFGIVILGLIKILHK